MVWLGDIPQTIVRIASGSEDPRLDGRSLLPFAEDPARRSTRPILLEADTGAGGAEAESAKASAVRAKTAKVGVAGKKGVTDLEQETDAIKSQAAITHAPAYRAIRTTRYLYVLYSNGQTELYDMLRDPAQLNSLARNKRYRFVRKWLFDHLAAFSTCAGPSCRVEVGPEPVPLPKSVLRPPRPKKKGKGKPAGQSGQEVGVGPPGLRFCGHGALAKLAKAPVSKTGDSRFESWVPRYRPLVSGLFIPAPSRARGTPRTTPVPRPGATIVRN